jgi:hypothetical protein
MSIEEVLVAEATQSLLEDQGVKSDLIFALGHSFSNPKQYG